MSRVPQRWSAEEDRLLIEQISLDQAGNWAAISSLFPGKSNKDCRKRWTNHLQDRLRKGSWDADEDARLRTAVEKHGKQRWPLVSKDVGTRSADQCAKRWVQSLDPELDRTKWTRQDEKLLLAAVNAHGRAWKAIQGQYFSQRSANNIKNRYMVLTKRGKIAPSPSDSEQLHSIADDDSDQWGSTSAMDNSHEASVSVCDSEISSPFSLGALSHGPRSDTDKSPDTEEDTTGDILDFFVDPSGDVSTGFDCDLMVADADGQGIFSAQLSEHYTPLILADHTGMLMSSTPDLAQEEALGDLNTSKNGVGTVSVPNPECVLTIQSPTPDMIVQVVNSLVQVGARFNMEMK